MAVGFQRPGLFGMGQNASRGPYDTPGIGDGMVAPPSPFLWGAGGSKYSPEQVEQMRAMAQAEMQDATSGAPVAHWLQGLNRSLGAVTGGLRMRKADKAGAEIAAESDAVTQALLANPDKQTVLAALANPRLSKGGQSVAELLAGQMYAKPSAPHYWETNDGSLGMVGPDGQPTVLYKDPTPKVDYITADNGDGTKQLIPVVNGQVMGGGGQASGAAPAAPPATLPADFFDDDKGGPASAPGGFPGGR